VTDTLAPGPARGRDGHLRPVERCRRRTAGPILLVTLEWGKREVFSQQTGQGLFEDLDRELGFARRGHRLVDLDRPRRISTAMAAPTMSWERWPEHPIPRDPQTPSAAFLRAPSGAMVSTQLIEGYYRRRPALTLAQPSVSSATAIPSISKRFPRNEYFERADLGEILGEEKLAQARRFAVKQNFRTVVFLSPARRHLPLRALPRMAQISPAARLWSPGNFVR